jgi:hypothetical protein
MPHDVMLRHFVLSSLFAVAPPRLHPVQGGDEQAAPGTQKISRAAVLTSGIITEQLIAHEG